MGSVVGGDGEPRDSLKRPEPRELNDMLIFFILAALAYGSASFAFGAGSGPESTRKWGRRSLFVAACMHLATIGGQCLEGNHPFRSVYLVSSLIVFLMVMGYLGLSSRGRELRAMGAILGPVGLIGTTLGVWLGPGSVAVEGVSSPLMLWIHIGAAVFGVVGFGLSAGIAGLYLALERSLRTKTFSLGQNSGLSLKGLERMHGWLGLAAIPVFTVAIVTGVLVFRGSQVSVLESRGIELIAASIAWLASVVSVIARTAWGIRGRRAAWLSIVAFASMLIILISYGVRG